ncbi:zinc-dependent alcohol dehydrogenase [Halegenticoccus tardaugens]|uniref:zinc-dependent alcohol dehydrogenase n=1 Tax=Halegenticoccus tardaugens TaxID=2071624 RepID=UPI00100A55E4|nr:alcohol dehydrogenase catalytic domain-containing protein [Halegenticoccus tardaugens]
MKAIVQTGPEEVEVQERKKPRPKPNEVLVEVHSAGLCGSDAHAYKYDGGYEWIPIPRIMGHEYSGRVVGVGANVERFVVDQKVIEEPIHDCGECFQCKNGQENVCQNFSITGMHTDGAYTEYIAVDQRHLHVVPRGVSLREAAITEPASIAARAVFDRSVTTPGDNVLVEGPGPIGVLTAVIADSLGANVVVSGLKRDASYRLPLLEEQGIDTVNVQKRDLAEVTEKRTSDIGFDVVFDATGHRSGVEKGVEHVRKGGQVVMIGIPNQSSDVFLAPVVRGEIDVNTSYGSKWRNFEQALRLMESGAIDIDAIIDTAYDIEDPERAFRAFFDSETCKPVFTFVDD